MIKAVIFDFNGTLVYDTHLHDEAWDIFLKRYEMNLSEAEKSEKIHGKNNAQIFRGFFDPNLSPEMVEHYTIEKESIYQTLYRKEGIELAPGATDFLSYLKRPN